MVVSLFKDLRIISTPVEVNGFLLNYSSKRKHILKAAKIILQEQTSRISRPSLIIKAFAMKWTHLTSILLQERFKCFNVRFFDKPSPNASLPSIDKPFHSIFNVFRETFSARHLPKCDPPLPLMWFQLRSKCCKVSLLPFLW